MFVFEGTCPHCASDRGFTAFGASNYCIGEYDYTGTPTQDRAILEQRRQSNPNTVFSLSGTCLACRKPVVATCEASDNTRKEIEKCVYEHPCQTAKKVTIRDIYPKSKPPYTHSSLPESVRNSFIDLQKMLQQGLQPHFIITGCRTVLEVAVKELGGEGDKLKQRITDLHTKGQITTVLADWANHVRLTGNDAVHDMSGTADEAGELVEFTKTFLQFTFEMPARIAEIRKISGKS